MTYGQPGDRPEYEPEEARSGKSAFGTTIEKDNPAAKSKPSDVKNFIKSVEDARKNWLFQAQGSWNEIKKLKKSGQFWSIAPNSARKYVRFPLWNSTFRIRKPIVYSRTPVPVGKDMFGGNDEQGRRAAILLERLAKAIQKSFDFDEGMSGARDDRLVTCLGWGRAYYEKEDITEAERVELQAQVDEMSGQLMFFEDGERYQGKVLQDENGYYYETSRVVGVTNEKVCFKACLYSHLFIDPSALYWSEVKELAYQYDYSKSEFISIFGKAALDKVQDSSLRKTTTGIPVYRVYEYWNKYERRIYWMAENADEFLKVEEDLYDLCDFFPMPKPMIGDKATDSIYPICEFYQLNDLIEEIHTLATRIFTLTRAIRVRLLFDNTVEGLQAAINELTETDAIGVAHLAEALTKAGGSIENVVAYFPVEKMITGLKEMYAAFDQRLQSYYQLTGTSDLLRGQTDSVERTYGEQQMKAKYAMNQIEPIQRDMQRFAKDSLEILCEMALKNFSDESLAKYIVPATLDRKDAAFYESDLALLKRDKSRRFRIELETDSTIAINEDYEKSATLEMAQVVTQAMTQTADIMQKTPMLASPMISLTREVIESFRKGKLVESDAVQALSQIAEQLAQPLPPAPPPPDYEQQRIEIERAREAREAFKVQSDRDLKLREIASEMQKVFAEIDLKQEELSIEAAKVTSDAQSEQIKLELQSEIAAGKDRLANLEFDLESYKVTLDEREKYMTEARLQFEAQQKSMVEAAVSVPQPQAPPMVLHIHNAPGPKISQGEVIRDPLTGNIIGTRTTEIPVPVPPVEGGVA